MASINWTETTPSGTSEVREIDDHWQSFQSNIRGGLDDEHDWSSAAGVADRGTHTPNASRVSFGATHPATVGSRQSGLLFLDTDAPELLFAYPDVSGSIASYPVASRNVNVTRAAEGNITPSIGNYFGSVAVAGTSGSVVTYGVLFASETPHVTATVRAATALFAVVNSRSSRTCLIDAYTGLGVASTGDNVDIIAFGEFDIS